MTCSVARVADEVFLTRDRINVALEIIFFLLSVLLREFVLG